MTDYPYEPPEREFADTMLAFVDFQMANTWRVRIEDDPLGPVNKIVTLMRGDHRVKSVLHPVGVGTAVRMGRDDGAPLIRTWTADWSGIEQLGDSRPPAWYVEIDGKRVIEVPEHETYPPRTPPTPVPLWRRMRTALLEQLRSDADAIAKRFGYHRDENCGGDW